MPFSGLGRRFLRSLAAVGLYLGLWFTEVTVLTVFFRRPFVTVLYLPEQPLMVNTLIYLAIPSAPLAAVAWFYSGRGRDKAMLGVAFLFAALVWIPWLGTYSVPLSTDVLAAKGVSNGYNICGIYRATTEWNTFVYDTTLSRSSRCMFILLRPEPRFNYGLRINLTARVFLLNSTRENRYTFYTSHFIATQFYLIPPDRLPDFQTPYAYTIPWKAGNTIDNRIKPKNLILDDVVYWFVFSPEPGSAVVRVTITIEMRAEPR